MKFPEDQHTDFVDISEAKDRGILKKITRPSTSRFAPHKKDTVFVHYVGTYLGGEEDGKKFDSSRDRNEQFSFTLGTGDVVKAWDVCVATMHMGEMCDLIVAPEYGYNDGKVMKFEIELFSAKGEDVSLAKDGSVRKSILEEGEGYNNPTVCGQVTIQFRLLHDNDTDKEPAPMVEASFVVGDPDLTKVPAGLDEAVRSMTLKERAQIGLLATPSSTQVQMYEVTVVSFEKFKRIASLDKFDDRIKYANELKERANQYLKQEKYNVAIGGYKRIEEELIYMATDGPVERRTLEAVRVALYNNCALAQLKLGDMLGCIEMCQKAVGLEAHNEKALFRMGQAELARKDHDEALKHFQNCLLHHPNNEAAKCMVEKCRAALAKADEDQKRRLRGVYKRCKDTGLGDFGDDNNNNGENDDDDDENMGNGHHGGCDSCDSSDKEEAMA